VTGSTPDWCPDGEDGEYPAIEIAGWNSRKSAYADYDGESAQILSCVSSSFLADVRR